MFSTEQMKDNENHIQSFNAVRLRNDENEVPVVIVDQHQEGLFSKLLAQTRSEKIPNILTFWSETWLMKDSLMDSSAEFWGIFQSR